MKKNVFTVVFIATLIALSGCSSTTSNTTSGDGQPEQEEQSLNQEEEPAEEVVEEEPSLYDKWMASQKEPEQGDLYDDMKYAAYQIRNGLDTGKIGTPTYKASVDILVPESEKNNVGVYISTIERYLTDDQEGPQHFIDDMVSAGIMAVNDDGKAIVVEGKTLGFLIDELNITRDMALAVFGELEEYGGQFGFNTKE